MADSWFCCGRQVQLAMRQMQQIVANCNISQDRGQDMFVHRWAGGTKENYEESIN